MSDYEQLARTGVPPFAHSFPEQEENPVSLSRKSQSVLSVLAGYSRPVSARQLADRLDAPRFGARRWTYARTYAILRRAERDDLVDSRGRRPKRWAITARGNAALRD
jgi:DNA-binding PadR family transcriptional regulator